MKILWYKMNDKAIIPTKTEAAAGFDIYTTEDFVRIEPHCQYLFATGLGVIPEERYWLMVFDRGSTGSKGLHVHCGVIDNDYRGEIFICIKNDNPYPVIITRSVDQVFYDTCGTYSKVLYYPASKAIAQIIPVRQPIIESKVCDEETWQKSCGQSLRGAGKLGSSGK